MPDSGRATIREVYDITNRLDDKIDKNHKEVLAEIESLRRQVAVYAAGVGGGASVVMWFVTNFVM